MAPKKSRAKEKDAEEKQLESLLFGAAEDDDQEDQVSHHAHCSTGTHLDTAQAVGAGTRGH